MKAKHKHQRKGAKNMDVDIKVYRHARRQWIAEVSGKRVPTTFESEADAWDFLLQLAVEPSLYTAMHMLDEPENNWNGYVAD
jgi:hypothetical protein